MSADKAKIEGNALGRQQRIKTPEEFKRVYESKQWGGTEYFSFNVLAHQAEDHSASRLGVTVSKRVAKQAVVRNRIRRQIKEYYRCNNDTLVGLDLVISAKPASAKASAQERLESLQELWQKIHKWQRWYLAKQKQVTI